jgi:hypothetical protein
MAATDPKVNGYDRFGWVDMLRFIHDNFAIAKIDNRWGVINAKGEIVIPCIYQGVTGILNTEYFIVEDQNGQKSVIDIFNNVTFEHEGCDIQPSETDVRVIVSCDGVKLYEATVYGDRIP